MHSPFNGQMNILLTKNVDLQNNERASVRYASAFFNLGQSTLGCNGVASMESDYANV